MSTAGDLVAASATRPTRELYGLDKELHEKMMAKIDPNLETNLLKWVESMIGHALPSKDFFQALRSGYALCELANAIRPGVIARINDKPINGSVALMERDNIKLYLQACVALSLPTSAMFLEADLHDGRYLPAVHANLQAMQARAEQEKKLREYIALRQARKLKGVNLDTPLERLIDLLAAREGTFDPRKCTAELAELRQHRVRTAGHLLRLYRRKEYWERVLVESPLKRHLEDALFDLDLDSPKDLHSGPPTVLQPPTAATAAVSPSVRPSSNPKLSRPPSEPKPSPPKHTSGSTLPAPVSIHEQAPLLAEADEATLRALSPGPKPGRSCPCAIM